MKHLHVPAKLEFLYEAIAFVTRYGEENGFHGEMSPIELAVEEIFCNIASYAYPAAQGEVDIGCGVEGNDLVIEFADTGIAFNPLLKQDPDISLSAATRPVGGLGIYIVKNSMDFVGYERKEDKNILVLKKRMENR